MNPAVRGQLEQSLRGLNSVELVGPIAYQEFVRTLAGSRLVLTDSGGVQEEAAALGIPALVTREVTERTDGLEAGAARIVGTSEESIVAAVHDLIVDDDLHAAMAGTAMRVYGDGNAAEKAANACAAFLRALGSLRSSAADDSHQRRRVSAMDAEAKWLYSFLAGAEI